MQPVRLGVIGCGVIGSRHVAAAAAADHIDLVAIADLRPQVVRQTAESYGVRRVYTEGADLIADPAIDAVVLAMPAHVRTQLGLDALAAGKHLLTEKPVAMNAGEVRQLLAAQGDRVVACASSRMHFLAGTAPVTEYIAGGGLGNLRVIRCRAIKSAGPPPQTPPPDWRLNRSLNGGGIMSNWGCYDLDYLLGITGWKLRPASVLAQTWRVADSYLSHVAPHSDAETHVAALIRCTDGTAITYERAEYAAARNENSWEIIGDRGSLILTMTPSGEKNTFLFQADGNQGVTTHTLWQGADNWDQGHAGPVTDFATAIQTGRRPQTDLTRALVIQEITDAIYRSAQSGNAVSLSAHP